MALISNWNVNVCKLLRILQFEFLHRLDVFNFVLTDQHWHFRYGRDVVLPWHHKPYVLNAAVLLLKWMKEEFYTKNRNLIVFFVVVLFSGELVCMPVCWLCCSISANLYLECLETSRFWALLGLRCVNGCRRPYFDKICLF